MTDYVLTRTKIAGKHGSSMGQRVLFWIETHQQRKADREIARALRRL